MYQVIIHTFDEQPKLHRREFSFILVVGGWDIRSQKKRKNTEHEYGGGYELREETEIDTVTKNREFKYEIRGLVTET